MRKKLLYLSTYFFHFLVTFLCADPNFHLASFSFAEKTSFHISYTIDLLVMKSQHFILAEKSFLSQFLKDALKRPLPSCLHIF